MPTIEWLKYGMLGLCLALAAYSFFLVQRALKEPHSSLRHVVLIGMYMLFSLSLATGGFHSEYLAKHDGRFARTASNALLTESFVNMRQDVAHCQSFLKRTALFLQAVGDEKFGSVDHDSRVGDTRCGDGVNSAVPLLQKYAK